MNLAIFLQLETKDTSASGNILLIDSLSILCKKSKYINESKEE
jgi:hypothetical protein